MNSDIYEPKLVKCFNLAFGTSNGNPHNFSNEAVFNLTPDHFYFYLANKGFGTTQPLDTDKPSQGRSNFDEMCQKSNFVFHTKQIDEVGFTKKFREPHKISNS